MKKDSLGDRMKIFYENIPKTHLTRRQSIIIRIDGKAFTQDREYIERFI